MSTEIIHHYFSGEMPCDKDGQSLTKVVINSNPQMLANCIHVDHTFSSKPQGGYQNYYDKMTAYVSMLMSHAAAIDPTVKATPFRPIVDTEESSVFQYFDTFSSRNNIVTANARHYGQRIAIVGLGGTGSYILDLVAKCPVAEIHLFDGDKLCQHNAFRTPGAASVDDLGAIPFKTDYLRGVYTKMHKHIHSHPIFLDCSAPVGMSFFRS